MTEVVSDQRTPGYVWVLGLAGGDEDDVERRVSFRPQDARLARRQVPARELQESVAAFVSAMGEAIAGIPEVLGGYAVDSIEISAEVSATGKVSLLGNGAELSGSGGISFTLTRQNSRALKADD